MNKNIIIITILSLCVIIFGILMTIFGIVKLSNLTVESFPSSNLNEQIKLMIYTPPAYSLEYKQRYPVLYLLEGEKYFIERKEERRSRWSVQQTLDRLIKEERLPKLIVVGITSLDSYPNQAFSQFLIEELVPYINTKYRTKARAIDTGIAEDGIPLTRLEELKNNLEDNQVWFIKDEKLIHAELGEGELDASFESLFIQLFAE